MKHTVDEITLSNGAKGLLIDVPGATVMDFELNFRAGHYLVDRKKWEIPHVMEHVVLGANKKYPKARLFQAEFEKNGAYSNATTSTYAVNYIAECADFEWKRVISLLRLSLEEPLFLEDEFKAEMGNVRDELTGDLNNHFRQLIIASRKNMGFLAMSDPERLGILDDIKVDDIKRHHEKTHTSANMRFIVAGNVAKRKAYISKTLEGLKLPRGKRIALPDEEPTGINEPLWMERAGVDNMYFFIETYSKRVLEPINEDALVLLNVMLTNTLHSRILGEAREKGLVYHMSSHFNNLKLGSAWWFGAQVMPDNAGALFEIITKEITAVLQGDIKNEDIEAARQYCLGRYQRGIQTVNGLLNGYGGGYFFDERIDDYYDIPERYKAVTKDQMVDIARSMFKDRVWGLSTLGTDQKQLTDDLYHRVKPLWG